jgi:hypothetical protein
VKFHDFLVDPQLGALDAQSFRTWHVVARLLDGDACLLNAPDLAIAMAITGRARFPSAAVRRFYAGLGRRAGKSLFESRRAVYFAAQDYRPRLQLGETAVVACIATDKRQAGVLFDYARACVAASPLLAPTLVRETADTLEFEHGTTLEVHAASFRSTRGRTFAAVLMDEAAFLRSEESAVPDVEVVRAVTPGLATLGGSLEVFSSLHMRRGVLWNAHRRHFGNDDSPAVFVQGATTLFNPTIDESVIGEARDEDPEAALAEWGGQFRNDLSAPFAELVDDAIDTGVRERASAQAHGKPRAWDYKSFTDPAGGQGKDSWSTRIVHAEGETVFDDAVLEIRPPFNTDEAAKLVADFLKSYGITHTQGDRYAGAWPSDALRRHGVAYSVSELDKSSIYKETLPLFSARRVRLLDHPRTSTQLRMIERRTRAGGKDSFDHPPGGSDDNANALCGALLIAGGRRSAGADRTVTISSPLLDGFTGHAVARGEPFVSIFEEYERRAADRWRDLDT